MESIHTETEKNLVVAWNQKLHQMNGLQASWYIGARCVLD